LASNSLNHPGFQEDVVISCLCIASAFNPTLGPDPVDTIKKK